jgi:C1A family cysteine protease
MSTERKFGWIKDKDDYRDLLYFQRITTVPDVMDLTNKMPEVYDQGSLGSCVFNALGAAFHYLLFFEDKEVFMPSRLFPYYNYREKENCVNEDSGAQIRTAIKTYVKKGVCKESDWDYDISKFTVKPNDFCYQDAMEHQLLKYHRLRNISQLEQCISEGYPVVCGISIYESFQTEKVSRHGHVPIPDPGKEQFLGGHAVMLVGFNRREKWFKVRNSWGAKWGESGYFYLPYAFVGNVALASDFWTIRLTE